MYFSDNHIKNRSHLQAFCPSTAIRTTRESYNKNKARRESLREPRDGQSVFGNACGSSANRKKNVLALAEVPQIKKRTFWRLRKFRKSKRERFSVCGSSANQKENALAFAGLPQIKKRTLWCLRKFRKSKRECFGVCGSSANQKKNVLALAEVPRGISKNTLAVIALYPSHSSGIRSLILSFKLTLQRFLEREIRRRGHLFRPQSIV